MIRCVLVVLASLTFLSPALASLARRDPPAIKRQLPLEILKPFCFSVSNDEFRITAATEVVLDGHPCRYSEVPRGATIILLELASNESKEIVKIHFQTKAPQSTSTQRRSNP